MENISSFLAMGGYAVFIWPCYVISALVLGGLFWQTLHSLRRAEAELAALDINRDDLPETTTATQMAGATNAVDGAQT